MSELKKGDRVAVYYATYSNAGPTRYTGRIVSISDDFGYHLKLDDGAGTLYAHRKQVRKLVKKPKREFWVILCDKVEEHNKVRPTKDKEPVNICDKCEMVKVREVKG